MTALDRENDIGLLAQGLGVAGGESLPVAAILDHCRTKVSGLDVSQTIRSRSAKLFT